MDGKNTVEHADISEKKSLPPAEYDVEVWESMCPVESDSLQGGRPYAKPKEVC